MSDSYFQQIISLLFVSLFFDTNGDTEYDYAMTIDAGSTHSALYIYRFEKRVTSTNMPPQSSPIQIANSDDVGPIGTLSTQHESDTLISVN